MTDPKPGAALTAVLNAAATRRGKYNNARANKDAEKDLIYNGDLTQEQLLEVQPRLKREAAEREALRRARNPHFLGS